MSNAVSIVEVGPRDGLQNEATSLTTIDKVQFIEALAQAGCKRIEVGSFVSPKWVPQMANSDEVLTQIHRKLGVTYSALTPNMQGVIQAIASGADEVAIFGAASGSVYAKKYQLQHCRKYKPLHTCYCLCTSAFNTSTRLCIYCNGLSIIRQRPLKRRRQHRSSIISIRLL